MHVVGSSFEGRAVRFLWATLIAAALLALWFLLVLTCPAPAAPPGGAIEVSSATLWHIFLSDVFVTYWVLIIPAMFIICIAMAAMFGATSGTTQVTPPPEINPENKHV
jgi:hypothetical protein